MKSSLITNTTMLKKPQQTAQVMSSHHTVLDMKDYMLFIVICNNLEEILKTSYSILKILHMSNANFT
jgi:hypothetical protein